jgi:amidase
MHLRTHLAGQSPSDGMASNQADALWQRDGAELAQLIRLGAISSREAVEASLARLEAVNPKLNAVVLTLADEALAAADEADARQRHGEALGPLHGVPVAVKINVDQRGCPTDHGVVAFKDLVANEDNPVVANLRRAGAIIIGRTNAPAHSLRWFTDNELHGRTLNPWDPSFTPGGSSGGAAAAVAAGIVPIAHGNDIGGSIRYPAYCCGVAGLRPTTGRVPCFNAAWKASAMLWPISAQLMAVQGPLARHVRDLRIAFAAMAVSDVRDPSCVEISASPKPADPMRVALVVNPGGRGVHPAVAQATRNAAECLVRAGYAVDEVEPPGLLEAADLWPKLLLPDLIEPFRPLLEMTGDDPIKRALLLWGEVWPTADARDALAALGERYRLLHLWQEFLEKYPLVVMPVSTQPPFEIDMDLRDKTAAASMIVAQAPLLATSFLGLPAISIPTGLHQGLPTGVQIVAGRFREDLCFDAAECIEHQLPMPMPIELRG